MARTVRLLVIALLCAAAAQPWGWAGDAASAQMVPRTGDQGTASTFTGQTYGVTVNYAGEWQVAGSGTEGGVDFLHLDNGTSKVSVVVGPGPQDVLDCADQTAMMFKESVPGFEDLRFDGWYADTATEVGVGFKAGRSQMSLVVFCMEFGDPEANIAFTWTVSQADFTAELPLAGAILEGIGT